MHNAKKIMQIEEMKERLTRLARDDEDRKVVEFSVMRKNEAGRTAAKI